MGVHWLAVLCALALLAQASLSYSEEEFEDIHQDEPEIPEEEEIKIRERRQTGCKDVLNYCALWPRTYCGIYKDYMKRNCPRKCGYCRGPTKPPVCEDKRNTCPKWKASGFCDWSNKYHNWMNVNCMKTCGFCGGGGDGGGDGGGGDGGGGGGEGGGGGAGNCSVSGASSKVKACSFDSDTCDWHNVPFDDDMDFVVRSSSSGGPSSGAGGSGRFLVTERSSGNAQLFIPFELVLAHHDSDHGSMCIGFYYFMKSGTLKLYSIQNERGSLNTTITTVSGNQRSAQWKCKRVTVEVSVHRQLLFVASASGSPIGLDDISFADNC